MKKLLIVFGLVCSCFISTSQTLPSKTEMVQTIKKVNDYWINGHPYPGNKGWARATYFVGNMEFYKIYPYPKYLDYANLWANNNNWTLIGGVNTRIADNHCCGQTYIDLYKLDAVPQEFKINPVKTSIYNMVTSAGYNDWYWIDALFMAMPVFSELGAMCNDQDYYDKMYALYADTKYARALFDPESSLWYRDGKYTNDTTPNGFKVFWSRGNGWVIAALARTLENLPETDAHRNDYENTLIAMAGALKEVQRSDGFWNVSLADPNDYGGPETSGTSLITYGIAWGIHNKLLDSITYMPVVIKAWNGLATKAVHADGKLGYVQQEGEKPASAQPVTVDSTSDFGVGAFLLAGSELVKLAPGIMPQPGLLTIGSVKAMNDSYVELVFNEPVQENSVSNRSNYSVSDGITVKNAVLSQDNLKITLELSKLISGTYTLTINNIVGISGHLIEPNTQISFSFSHIKSLSASSFEPGSTNYPEKTTDNDKDSRWSAAGDGAWIQYELTSVKNVESVAIAFFRGDERTTYFDIQLSIDGASFTNVLGSHSSGLSNDLLCFDIDDAAAKYVRIVGHGNNLNNWNSLTEVCIITSDKTVQTVTASSFEPGTTNYPENTIDKDLNTRWSAQGNGEWIQYALTSAENIESIDIAFYKGNQRQARFDILLSLDGLNFVEALSTLSSGTTNDPENYEIYNTRAKFVRILGHGNNVNSWNSITEVNIITTSNNFKSVTASSYESGSTNYPENTIDHDFNTRWSAFGDGEWIQYELYTAKTIESVDIAFYKGNERNVYLAILVSIDGTNFTEVFSGIAGMFGNNLENLPCDKTIAKFIRIVGHGNSDNNWNSFTEVSIVTTNNNIKSITASSYERGTANYPENTIDHDFNTRWSAFGDGEWIQYELYAVKRIESVDIAFFKGNQRYAFLNIHFSIDGIEFYEVFSGQSEELTNNFQTFAWATVPTKFVKIIGHGNSLNNWNSITEINFNPPVFPITTFAGNSDPLIKNALKPGDLNDIRSSDPASGPSVSLKTYPNPVKNTLVIDCGTNESSIFHYRIMNVAGTIMSEGIVNHQKKLVDLSAFSSGIYYIMFYTGNRKYLNTEMVIKE